MNDVATINKFMTLLEGKVFHATTWESYESIKNDGYIYPNQMDYYHSPFGSENGYFKSKGCVSFFDYRSTKKNKDYMLLCIPTRIFEVSRKMVILELSTKKYDRLISSSKWLEEDSSKKVVPRIEVGVKGPVSISDIQRISVYNQKASSLKTD
ncbi:hypothetical protein [Vibrio quintilis]|uniref:Uncharacterized protein n=1 Tax=Vibrio quintilis TaxID=1117707 RepID=A0A1M7YP29_9VIBR|nr:hypothetical protein [Vibrio quintilis]SHO54392.1 hypothetical protein VQ7734_00106 [Vibrio quintilis]